jgi:hypothetical protein
MEEVRKVKEFHLPETDQTCSRPPLRRKKKKLVNRLKTEEEGKDDLPWFAKRESGHYCDERCCKSVRHA